MTNKEKLETYQILAKMFKNGYIFHRPWGQGLCYYIGHLAQHDKLSPEQVEFLRAEIHNKIQEIGRVWTLAPLWNEKPRFEFLTEKITYYQKLIK